MPRRQSKPEQVAPGEKQQLNVFLPVEVVRELKHLAIDRGDSLSSLVEQIFREQLELARKEGKWLRS